MIGIIGGPLALLAGIGMLLGAVGHNLDRSRRSHSARGHLGQGPPPLRHPAGTLIDLIPVPASQPTSVASVQNRPAWSSSPPPSTV